MENIILTGQLICNDEIEVAIVKENLPLHIDLTRAESGCISFEVIQSEDPFIWNVAECFLDTASFQLHQSRVKASEWGSITANIKRNYSTTRSANT